MQFFHFFLIICINHFHSFLLISCIGQFDQSVLDVTLDFYQDFWKQRIEKIEKSDIINKLNNQINFLMSDYYTNKVLDVSNEEYSNFTIEFSKLESLLIEEGETGDCFFKQQIKLDSLKNFKYFIELFNNLMIEKKFTELLNLSHSIRKKADVVKLKASKLKIRRPKVAYNIDTIEIQGLDDFDDDFKVNMFKKINDSIEKLIEKEEDFANFDKKFNTIKIDKNSLENLLNLIYDGSFYYYFDQIDYFNELNSFFQGIYHKIKDDFDKIDILVINYDEIPNKILDVEYRFIYILPTYNMTLCLLNDLEINLGKNNITNSMPTDENYVRDTLDMCRSKEDLSKNIHWIKNEIKDEERYSTTEENDISIAEEYVETVEDNKLEETEENFEEEHVFMNNYGMWKKIKNEVNDDLK